MREFFGHALIALSLFVSVQPVMAQTASVSVAGQKEKDYHKLATVSMQDAIQAALAKVPGKAIEAELDDSDGFLVYEVTVIGADNQKHEVEVDAGNQTVLSTEAKKSFF